jgi:hypothetical protein
VIRYAPGREDSARTVAAAIPGAELKQADVEGIEVVVGRKNHTIKNVKVAASASPRPTTTPTTRTATQNICKN